VVMAYVSSPKALLILAVVLINNHWRPQGLGITSGGTRVRNVTRKKASLPKVPDCSKGRGINGTSL
jgi:hypothetical protein